LARLIREKDGRAWAGCVATATGQVMKYWEHPNTYTWSAMPLTSGSSETSALLAEIGDEVNMDYDCNSSSASTSAARNALVNDFDYSSSAAYVVADGTTIVLQIDNEWPVIMRGSGSGGGHAWVCDGYRRNRHIQIHNPGTPYEYETSFITDFYLYMNWGWGGYCDGWFLYNLYNPNGSNYSSNTYIIKNIHP